MTECLKLHVHPDVPFGRVFEDEIMLRRSPGVHSLQETSLVEHGETGARSPSERDQESRAHIWSSIVTNRALLTTPEEGAGSLSCRLPGRDVLLTPWSQVSES